MGIRYPLVEALQPLVIPADPRKGLLRLGQQCGGPVGHIVPIEAGHGGAHAVRELFRVLQQLPPGLQSLILAGL